MTDAEHQLHRGLSYLLLVVHPDIVRDLSALVAARIGELLAEISELRIEVARLRALVAEDDGR